MEWETWAGMLALATLFGTVGGFTIGRGRSRTTRRSTAAALKRLAHNLARRFRNRRAEQDQKDAKSEHAQPGITARYPFTPEGVLVDPYPDFRMPAAPGPEHLPAIIRAYSPWCRTTRGGTPFWAAHERVQVERLLRAASPDDVREAGFKLQSDGRIDFFLEPEDRPVSRGEPYRCSFYYRNRPWWLPVLWTLVLTWQRPWVVQDVEISRPFLKLFDVAEDDGRSWPTLVRPHVVRIDPHYRRVCSAAKFAAVAPRDHTVAVVFFNENNGPCHFRCIDAGQLRVLRAAPRITRQALSPRSCRSAPGSPGVAPHHAADTVRDVAGTGRTVADLQDDASVIEVAARRWPPSLIEALIRAHEREVKDPERAAGREALLKALCVQRRALADQQGAQPCDVVGDASVIEMAAREPRSLDEFARIHGIGAGEVENYGEAFVAVIRAHEHKVKKPESAVRRQALFEALRAQRRVLADRQGVLSYDVVHDAALVEMAARRPTTLYEVGMLTGIGATKLDRYGEAFVAVIRAHERGVGKQEKAEDQGPVLNLVRRGRQGSGCGSPGGRTGTSPVEVIARRRPPQGSLPPDRTKTRVIDRARRLIARSAARGPAIVVAALVAAQAAPVAAQDDDYAVPQLTPACTQGPFSGCSAETARFPPPLWTAQAPPTRSTGAPAKIIVADRPK